MGSEMQTAIGPLPSGWHVQPLRELATHIGSGATPRGGAAIYLEVRDKYAIVRSQNVFDRRFEDQGLAFIADSDAASLRGVELQADDVLLNITGDGITFARSCLVPARILPACVNQHVVRIRCDRTKCDPGYLVSFLTHPLAKEYIESFNAGGSRRAITKGHIESFQIPLPPLPEQQAIACILGALDDKIELNRRRNRTLEAMARAVFQGWFIDFDPVKAKAAGRKPAGLAKEIAALFPASFEDSGFGPIPQGWSVTSLADEITASKGLSYKGQHLCDPGEGLPMHNLNSVYEGGGYKNEGLKWYKGEYRPAHILKPGDVIVTNTEQGFDHLLIGYAAIVPERFGDKGLFSHHTYRLQQKATSYLPTWFVYLLLRTPVFHELVAGHSNGTTVNMLPLDGLQKPRFVLPPEELVKRFGKLFLPAQQQLERMYDESVTLAALRDSLLPKLISGELRVPDAERIVGRAV